MVLGALAVVLTALNVVLAQLVHQLTFLGVGPGIPVFLIYAGVGVVIARHQPRNPVAWVLIGFVLLAMVSADAGYYAVYCCSASATLGSRWPGRRRRWCRSSSPESRCSRWSSCCSRTEG